MRRIVFFTDSPSYVPTLHFEALLAAVAARDDFEIAGVVTANPEVLRPPRWRHARALAHERLVGWLDPARRATHPLPRPLDYGALARRRGFRVLAPEAGDVNEPRFVDRLAKELRPTVAFSCFCLRRFGRPLLGAFDQAVNYHDGHLPGYRGTYATSWSIYRGEPESGFCFHRMTPALDAGAILISGGVETRGDRLGPIAWRKTRAASRRIPELLEAIAEERPGQPQTGEARHHRLSDAAAIRRIEAPGALTHAELAARLRAFDLLHLKLAGRWWPVTRLEGVGRARGSDALGFTTKDGVALRPTRFRHLPRRAHRAREALRGRRASP